jgi:hypothetical protein
MNIGVIILTYQQRIKGPREMSDHPQIWSLSPVTFQFFLTQTMSFIRKNRNVIGDKDHIIQQ